MKKHLKPKSLNKPLRSFKGASFSRAQLVVFALAFGVIGYTVFRSFAATTADAVVTINPSNVYYTLPKYWLGGKMTAYSADIIRGNFQGGTAPKTNDNKTFNQLILESGLDSVSQSMVSQGTPSSPNSNWNDVRTLQYLMVKGGTENGVTYPGGAAASPHFMMNPNATPTTTAPELQPSNRAAAGSEGSRENIKAWIDKYVADLGLDHIMSVEYYNEPATENNCQLGVGGGSGDWYAFTSCNPPSGGGADRKAADFATNGHRVVDDYLKASYPTLTTYGGSYSSGAANDTWSPGEIDRFICGYSGWAWGSDCNTNHMSGLSTHSYGNAITNGVPGAPGGQPQSIYNSIFYPEGSTPTNPQISSGKSGYKAFQNYARHSLDTHGGQNNKMFMSEWWAYYNASLAPPEGARSAMGDILGVIVNAQNAGVWKQNGDIIHAINAVPYTTSNSTISPPDGMFGVGGGRLWRSQRYFAIRDMEAPFASRNGNKRLVSASVSSPASPGGVSGNPVNSIQTAVALNDAGTDMKILVANLDMVNSHSTQFKLGVAGTGTITGKYLPQSQPVDTALPSLPAISYDDSTKTSFTYTIGAGEAALIDIPIGQVTVQKPANTSLPTISGTTKVGSTLTVDTGAWTGPPNTYAYQWQDCDSAGANCVNIASAAASTYTLTAADLNKTIRVIVTASNSAGSASVTSAQTAAVADSVTSRITTNTVSTSHVVDGNLNESDWQINTPISKAVVGSSSSAGSFGALWDSNYLYIGAKITDSSLHNNNTDPWMNDAVEVFIDGDNSGGTTYDSHDWQYIQGWNSASLFASHAGAVATSAAKHAWAAVSGGYSVEIAIPWSELGVTPSANMSLGIDVAFDDNNSGTRDAQFVWAGTANDYADTSVFGKATLAGAPPASKLGDLNNDNQVNIQDLSIMLTHFNASATAAQGDLNGDGKVTILDLSILLSKYGS